MTKIDKIVNNTMLDIALKVLDNEATPAQARDVAEWFSTPEGEEALGEIYDCELELGAFDAEQHVAKSSLQRVYSNVIRNIRLGDALRRKSAGKDRRSWYWVAASTIIPLFLVVGILATTIFVWGRVESMSRVVVVADYGQKAKVQLGDGTSVHLNSDSKLSYSPSFGLFKRKVQLEGQAYFVVESDPKHPFVVDISGAEVVVTGTKFDVDAYNGSDKVVVTLDEGVVTFGSDNNSITLNPLQQLSYNRGNGNTAISTVEYGSASEWRYDKISLNRAPMSVLLEKMSRQYGIEFNVVDDKVYEYTYILRSENQTYGELVRSVERITPVRFTLKGNVVEVGMK